MTINSTLTDVLILCGGKGTRLQSIVSDRPKPMAPVGGKPFLAVIIDYLLTFHVASIILCTGYKSENIEEYYAKDSTIRFSPERSPLGTGGAVKNAERFVGSDPFFVLNGDSFSRIDLNDMLSCHISHNAGATIAVSRMDNMAEFGTVVAGADGRITGFAEKKSRGAPGLVNAGVYLFNKEIFSVIPARVPYSLEYDVFPKLRDCYAYESGKGFVDIGTEERYKQARKGL